VPLGSRGSTPGPPFNLPQVDLQAPGILLYTSHPLPLRLDLFWGGGAEGFSDARDLYLTDLQYTAPDARVGAKNWELCFEYQHSDDGSESAKGAGTGTGRARRALIFATRALGTMSGDTLPPAGGSWPFPPGHLPNHWPVRPLFHVNSVAAQAQSRAPGRSHFPSLLPRTRACAHGHHLRTERSLRVVYSRGRHRRPGTRASMSRSLSARKD
jgi:hypothetical protein